MDREVGPELSQVHQATAVVAEELVLPVDKYADILSPEEQAADDALYAWWHHYATPVTQKVPGAPKQHLTR